MRVNGLASAEINRPLDEGLYSAKIIEAKVNEGTSKEGKPFQNFQVTWKILEGQPQGNTGFSPIGRNIYQTLFLPSPDRTPEQNNRTAGILKAFLIKCGVPEEEIVDDFDEQTLIGVTKKLKLSYKENEKNPDFPFQNISIVE